MMPFLWIAVGAMLGLVGYMTKIAIDIKRRNRHKRRGFVFFFQRLTNVVDIAFHFDENRFIKGVITLMAPIPIQGPPNAVTQIFSNDPNGVTVVFLEADDTGKIFPIKGPLGFVVSDPSGTVNVIAGSADGTTPEQLAPNGSGKTGTVTVTVTDTGNNIVASGTLTVVPPAPPPVPTQGAVFFTPNTTPPAAPAAGSSAAAAASAPVPAKTDPHGNTIT